MKLTRPTETIIAEDSGASLHKHIVELEKDKDTLQHAVDHGIEDYDLRMTANKNMSSENDELKNHCEGLYAELAKARSDTQKGIADHEVNVKFAKAHSIDIATDGEKHFR
jgi:hypothetical protein